MSYRAKHRLHDGSVSLDELLSPVAGAADGSPTEPLPELPAEGFVAGAVDDSAGAVAGSAAEGAGSAVVEVESLPGEH